MPFTRKALAFSAALLFSNTAHADIVFSCDSLAEELKLPLRLKKQLNALDIAPQWLTISTTAKGIQLSLANPGKGTLDLSVLPEYSIQDEQVSLPTADGAGRTISTVSKKEIALAMLHPDRKFEYSGPQCGVPMMVDEIGIRQNIVAWSERPSFEWPDGGPARWRESYWVKGTPSRSRPLADSVMDMFINPKHYAVGCYTATKLMVTQGVLDYYNRVAPDARKLAAVEQRLWSDGDPLVGIEPERMWYFDSDHDPEFAKTRPGKLNVLIDEVPTYNYVPGDWVYLLNQDPVSNVKTGYEGSNAIYLGRNRLDDYYSDKDVGYYTFEEKLDEVYQWRNGVFSRSRHSHLLEPLTQYQRDRLFLTPEQGGLAMSYRAVPRLDFIPFD